MPIINFTTIDQVPEGLRPFALHSTEDGGKITVNVVPAKKIDDFRDANIALVIERDRQAQVIERLTDANERLTEIVGEDPDNFAVVLADLRETQKALNAGVLVHGRQVEESIVRRTEQMRKNYDGAITEAHERYERLAATNQELRDLVKQVVNVRAIEDDIEELTRIRDLVYPT